MSRLVLDDFLTPKQKRQRDKYNYIELTSNTGRLFRIELDSPTENILEWDPLINEWATRYCCHIEGLPLKSLAGRSAEEQVMIHSRWREENFIGQLLMLTHDEASFYEVACEC